MSDTTVHHHYRNRLDWHDKGILKPVDIQMFFKLIEEKDIEIPQSMNYTFENMKVLYEEYCRQYGDE